MKSIDKIIDELHCNQQRVLELKHNLVLNNQNNVNESKIGILLINTGTPDSFDFISMWKYLRQFLSDSRVVELSKFIWYPILYLFILTMRPFSKGVCYKKIWNLNENDSPIRIISKKQAELLQQRFDKNPEKKQIIVEWGFRYGNPAIEEKIDKLEKQGCDSLIAFPLFPQYTAATVGSCCDQVFKKLLKQRNQMSIHTITSYYKNDIYMNAIIDTINNTINNHHYEHKFDVLIITYHGLPFEYLTKGDIYYKQCQLTTKMIQNNVNIKCITTFQSRMGLTEWIKPYTDDVVVELAKNGYKRILIIAPGFSSDCLETLEEINFEIKEKFYANGGEEFVYISALNNTAKSIDVLENILRKKIQGFL